MVCRKILLVDDDEEFNLVTKEILERAGYQVAAAFDGDAAESLFRRDPPDLVLTDIIMPDQNGLVFLHRIATGEGEFPCKVIAMSGGGRIGTMDFLESARTLGVNDCLEKPFSKRDLLECVGRQLA